MDAVRGKIQVGLGLGTEPATVYNSKQLGTGLSCTGFVFSLKHFPSYSCVER